MNDFFCEELAISEIQTRAFVVLKHVASFCEERGLNYSLAYGTLIGAVRHRGFIPWDDDIDIIMPRSDYDVFISSYEDSRFPMIKGDGLSNHLHVVVSDSETVVAFDSQYDSYFYKGGIWVDIFPIDLVPDDKLKYESIKRRIKISCKLQHLAELSITRKKMLVSFFLYLIHLLLSPFKDGFGKYADKLMIKSSKSGSNTCANLSLWYLNYPPFPKKWMDTYVNLYFEGKEFKVLSEYDFFLRRVYGDYMQFPPEEKRVPRHQYKAYYK